MSRHVLNIPFAGIQGAFRLFGRDAHVQRDGTERGFFEFERERSPRCPGDAVYRCFGLEIFTSRMPLGLPRWLPDSPRLLSEGIIRLFGFDAHIQRDTSGVGFWAFEREQHGPLDAEYWGCGLHLTVSRLQRPPSVNP